MNETTLQWADLAFASKKPLRELNATFIAAPRELSSARLTQLVKEYLPSGNIVIGCADEPYIQGFENQPQFKTLAYDVIEPIASKVNNSASPHKVIILRYRQRDVVAIYEKVAFRKVVLVNGSWHYSFHTRPEYYALISRAVPLEFVSPFTSEDEARAYAQSTELLPSPYTAGQQYSETDMMRAASQAATASYDTSFQTGTALGKKQREVYELIATSFNKVTPYATFAWHFGPLREKHLAVAGDLTYYDAVHAETMLILNAQKEGINLQGTSLFINLLPCPNCARMFCESDIQEFVYAHDHSSGYAVALLEKAGKTVRRVASISDTV